MATASLPPSSSFFGDDVDKFVSWDLCVGGEPLDGDLAVQSLKNLVDSLHFVLA